MAMTGHTTPSSISQVESTFFTMIRIPAFSGRLAVLCHHWMSFGSCVHHLHTVLTILLVMRVSSFLITYHTNRLWARTKLINVKFAIPLFFFIFNSVFPVFPSSPKSIFVMCKRCSFCLRNAQHSYAPSQNSCNCLAFHLHIIILS